MKQRTFLTALLDHLFLFRVPLLAPVWTVFLYGAAKGRVSSASGPDFTIPLFVAFSLLVGSIYIMNQIFDIESDRLNNKLFILPAGRVRLPTAWTMAVISMVFPVMTAFGYGRIAGSVFLLSAVFGILYNCRPFELKNNASGGLLLNTFGHGFLTFAAGWFSVAGPQRDFWLPAVVVSLANGAVYLCTTIVDVEGDKRADKKTFAVRFGKRWTAVTALIMVTGCLVTSLFIDPLRWVLLSTAAVSFPFFIAAAASLKRFIIFKAFKVPVFIFTCCIMVLFWKWYPALILITFWGARLYYQKNFNKCYPTFKSE